MKINTRFVEGILNNNGELFDDFQRYGKIYLSATENVSKIFDGIDLTGKKVLSVAGSGDQALNAIYNNAEEVTLFDINPLAFAQSELKLAAAKALEYPEFLEYFTYGNGNVLNTKSYDKIAPYLDKDIASYYEFLYSNYSTLEIFKKTVFPFYVTPSKLERINNYMGEENYSLLKEKVKDKKFKYIETDLLGLNEVLEKTYYAILLSNISDSLEYIFDGNVLKSYKRFIHTLSKHLDKDGFIQCGYVYNSYKGHTVQPIFASDDARRKVFTPDEFNEKDIESYQFYSSKDKIITFQKKRRKVS